MSLDIEARLKEYLSSAPSALHIIETLEISHSAMTAPRYLWREPYEGTITTEDGDRDVERANFMVKLAGSDAGLDQVFDITLDTTHIEDEFRAELDLIPIDTTERIEIIYREYLSDDLTDVLSRAVLQAETISYERGAASIRAIVPRYSLTRTGEIFAPRFIPMLRGFL